MKLFKHSFVAAVVVLSGALSASADTLIVSDNFESYADQTALKAVWVPTVGGGGAAAGAADVDAAYLIGCATCAPITDPVNYPDIQGQAVDHIGATASTPGEVNQWGGLTANPFQISPSASQSVKLVTDIFVGSSGNERMTVGLRARDPAAANLIEMGAYNANTCDPTVAGCNPSAAVTTATPGFIPSKGYAYRLTLFDSFGAPLIAQPNWQYFNLPAGLDRTTDSDEIVTIGDVGAGWHTYTAVVTPTSVTVSIDLFRDGFINTRDENGVIIKGSGTPGVDATATYPLNTNLTAGFDSLRIGGPSGLSSAGAGYMAFDNINLSLVDVVAPGVAGDYNGNGVVDAADYVVWKNGGPLQHEVPGVTPGTVTQEDYDAWVARFGNTSGSGVSAGGGVPEPTAAVLAIVGCIAAFAAGRTSR